MTTQLFTRLTLILAFLLIFISSEAQKNQEINRAQKSGELEAARAAVITEKLGLTPEQAEKFWPVYREFNTKRHELRRTFFEAQRKATGGRKPGKEPPALSAEEQKKLLDLGLDIRQQELDLERQYAPRFLEVLSADQVLRLHRAERDFQQRVIQHLRDRKGQGGGGPPRGPRGGGRPHR